MFKGQNIASHSRYQTRAKVRSAIAPHLSSTITFLPSDDIADNFATPISCTGVHLLAPGEPTSSSTFHAPGTLSNIVDDAVCAYGAEETKVITRGYTKDDTLNPTSNCGDRFSTPGLKLSAASAVTPQTSNAFSVYTSSDDEFDIETEKARLQLRLLELEHKRKDKRKHRSTTLPNPRVGPVNVESSAAQPPGGALFSLEQSLKAIVHSVGLPKLDVERFDGEPLKYHSFMRGFESNIADRLPDDTQRLNYLVYYCSGRAKEAINHCLLLSGECGYYRAKEILKQEFGRPHDIVQAVTKDLLDGPRLRAGDTESLKRLVTQMRTWHLTLCQLSRPSEVDSSTNLVRIVCRLPRHLQEKWAEVAESIIDRDREPCFSELLEFVERRVQVASSLYGQLASTSHNPIGPDVSGYQEESRRRVYPSRVTALKFETPNSADPGNVCVHCGGAHDLQKCMAFCCLDRGSRSAVLREHKRCFRCFKPNHLAQHCKVTLRCTVQGCQGQHHTLMHSLNRKQSRSELYSDQPSNANCSATIGLTKVALGFIPMKVHGPWGSVTTYALIDNGSDSTLILEGLAKKIGLRGKSKEVRFTTLNSSATWESQIVSLTLQSLTEDELITVGGAYTVRRLPYSTAPYIGPEELSKYSHLRDVDGLEHYDRRVGLLIGCDVLEAHVTLDQRIGRNGEPFATQTKFGWIVRGPLNSNLSKVRHVNCVGGQDVSLADCVAKFYELEFKDDSPGEKDLSVEDREAFAIVERTTSLTKDRYVVGLPWRPDRSLPDNYSMAIRRLELLRKRLVRDPELEKKYRQVINEHETKGYISRVCSTGKAKRWFLPHHPVFHPNKPGKVRIVFDCAASFMGQSLNSVLLSGPDLTNDLTGVLVRFRKHMVAVCADIQEMFLQVSVPEGDRNSLSFLWWPSEDLESTPEVYQLNVHPFGATSSPFCATYALRRTVADNTTSDACKQAILDNFYVDDCLISVQTVNEAKELVASLRDTLRKGGFKLTKWNTNTPEVISDLPGPELGKRSEQDLLKTCIQSTLGLQWHTSLDHFQVKLNLPAKPVTRRGVLACVSSIYDPLGFVAPMTLPARALLQDLCTLGIGWDTSLPETHTKRWQQWLRDIVSVETLMIPRCLGLTSRTVRTELHVFSDASELGYGAAGYLRVNYMDGSIACTLIMGKSRVAPKKVTTLPRLELVAALLASKLLHHLLSELRMTLDGIFMWCDSMIVLRYLSNRTSRFATFVANRVRLINQLTNGLPWHHVPSEHNPTDVASRGSRKASSKEMTSWLRGPAFLMLPPNEWPSTVIDTQLSEEDPEVRNMAVEASERASDFITERLAPRYSSWIRLIKGVSWLRRFVKFVLHKFRHGSEPVPRGRLSVTEMEDAERIVITATQRVAFYSIIAKLKNGVQLNNRKFTDIYRLAPVLLDDALYLGGRVSLRSGLRLLLLPSKSYVTDLIIRHHHVSEGHVGASHVLAAVRKRFWIVKGMASVRRVLHRCIQCKLLYPEPCE
jgi:hypothetical protein